MLGSSKAGTIDTPQTEGCQMHCDKCKKPGSKRQHAVWFHLYGNLEDYHVDILEKVEL